MPKPFEPVVVPLPPTILPSDAFDRVAGWPHCLWLDSALTEDPRSRYSFIAADPVDWIEISRPTADPLAAVERWLADWYTPSLSDLPPFQGGVAGFLAYEFGRCWERIPAAAHDEFELPLAVLGLYDVVLAWDHVAKQGWLISQGFDHRVRHDVGLRASRARARAEVWLQRLGNAAMPDATARSGYSIHAMAHGLTAPQFETRLGGGWLGNFDSHGYRDAVQRAREYIRAGDIFQVNLSQRLLCPARCDSKSLYQRLRQVNPAPFAGYFDMGIAQIVSASPERFIQVHDRWIETRPIKGTRRRRGDSATDAELERELRRSPKDRSENIMIVDLLRNDLSRVCEVESLTVAQLCDIEAYPFVLHMVSCIRGRLRQDAGFSRLMSSVFPGGSITGAPKVRSMEIIAELEPTVRGPYCGSLGYTSVDGNMDWNILIRTLTASRGWWQFQVGGGIVADSMPELEEEETWTKAAGIVAAIDSSLSIAADSLGPLTRS